MCCLFISHSYGSIFGDVVSVEGAKNPQGIYFENKNKASVHSSASNIGVLQSSNNYNYNVSSLNNNGKKNTSLNVSSGDGDIRLYADKHATNNIQNTVSLTSVNVTLLSTGADKSLKPFDVPLADADNPDLSGPTGETTGSVEAHVGAPVGNGIFLLLVFTGMLLFYKRKRLIRGM